jgi:hypothetical protein
MKNDGKEPKVSIENLAANKKVIPIYFLNGDVWHTDIKLPDIVLINHTDAPVAITEVTITGYNGEKEVLRLKQDQESIAPILKEDNRLLNKLLNSTSQWAAYNKGMLFGKIKTSQTSFEESTLLEPSAATCLRLSNLFVFNYVGALKIDKVICKTTVTDGEENLIISYPVQLTIYQCKGEYIFPIKGKSTIVGTAWNRVFGHRLATSQEFAFDVVDYRLLDHGIFSLSNPPDSTTVKDYFFFERAVLSIGDGTVVASGNRWPNAWAENPQINPDDRIVEQTQQLLEEGMDFTHAILGNYAIIDHLNGEFSVYAHMSENTVTVEAGDKVKKGQVIGKVGNTSNSDCPHLHFHLMDSPDFISANGLPITFSNLPNSQAPFYDFTQSNSLLYSDYLFLSIPE